MNVLITMVACAQAQLSASNSELEGRAAELARLLEAATREAAAAKAQAGKAQEALQETQSQVGWKCLFVFTG